MSNYSKATLEQQSKVKKGGAAALALLAASPFVFFTQVWVLMLAFGGLHSVFEKIPAIGFWFAALLLLVSSILFKSNVVPGNGEDVKSGSGS